MKVRWNRSSVRLRITPSEMSAILRSEPVAEELLFPGGLRWRIAISPGEGTDLSSEDGAAILYLSPADRENLAAPDAEGVYFDGDNGLRYFVEKDFPCAHPRAAEALEPITETFTAPADFERRKQEPDTLDD